MDEFEKWLQTLDIEIQNYIQNDLPDVVGMEAVNFFKQSFLDEGFTDKELVKWDDVKRRTEPRNPERASASRPILTGDTGDLMNSIKYEVDGTIIKVFSDSEYADAHNFGTDKAGRNKSTVIKKRQFIGESETLDKKILDAIEFDLNKLNKK